MQGCQAAESRQSRARGIDLVRDLVRVGRPFSVPDQDAAQLAHHQARQYQAGPVQGSAQLDQVQDLVQLVPAVRAAAVGHVEGVEMSSWAARQAIRACDPAAVVPGAVARQEAFLAEENAWDGQECAPVAERDGGTCADQARAAAADCRCRSAAARNLSPRCRFRTCRD